MHRTFALAALARETQVQRFVDVLAVPSAIQRVALQDLEQQARAPARGMLLLSRDHVARTHRAGLVLPAIADADTATHRIREPAVIREAEMRGLADLSAGPPARTLARWGANGPRRIFMMAIWTDAKIRPGFIESYTSSRTLSASTVSAILLRCGVPFASDSANFVA